MTTQNKSLTSVEFKAGATGALSAVFCTLGSGGPEDRHGPDLDGDVIRPSAFTNGAPVLISAWQHGSWTAGLPPIGKGTIRVTASEAILDGKLFMGTAAGREMYEILSDLGGLAEWSWSLHDIKSSVGNWQGRPCRIITSVNVSEVSPVLKGAAGPGRSRTLAMKDGGIDPDQRADLERIRRQLTALTPAQRAEMAAIRARVSR